MVNELFKAILVHSALYGCYAVLFALSVHIHWKKQTSSLWVHLTFLSTLFALATIGLVAAGIDASRIYVFQRKVLAEIYSTRTICTDRGSGYHLPYYEFDIMERRFYQVRALVPLSQMKGWWFTPMAEVHLPELIQTTMVVRICYVLSNLIADLYITYRCYVVWGRSKKIIALPLLLIIITLVFQIGPGKLFEQSSGYFVAYMGGLGVTLLTNMYVTLLTAGRIWWMGRDTSLFLNRKLQSRSKRGFQIILESGMLYPVTLGALIPAILYGINEINSLIAVNLCIVNIAPTLIIIRVGLGVSADDVKTTLQTFKATERAGSFETVTVVERGQSAA